MPREDGTIHKEDVLEKVDENTILVSVMCVNNETGAIMNVTDIFSAVKAKNSDVICHTDAVQAFGKISLSASRLHADLISVSGHKIHAPKGVGAIFVKRVYGLFRFTTAVSRRKTPSRHRGDSVDCRNGCCLW